MAVGAIAKEDYDRLCPHLPAEANPLAEQHGWFYDETGSFIGVVFRDKADNDWGWVVLARDERFVFRCIEVDSSLSSRDEARASVQLKIAQLLTSPRRIFATGHPGGQ